MKSHTLRLGIAAINAFIICGLALESDARTCSNSDAQDGIFFSVKCGSTQNEDAKTSFINYVRAEVEGPPLKGYVRICAELHILSERREIYSATSLCKGPSDSDNSDTIGWYVYKPDSADSRLEVVQGDNEIRINFTYVYQTLLDVPKNKDQLRQGFVTVSTEVQ
ncbi:MAG: hypothetical protein GY835_11725 [bacterium]|nr:hypothetical protein [bacterium]